MEAGSVLNAPRPRSGSEVQRILALDRAGAAYLVVRNGAGAQLEIPLGSRTELAVGRDRNCDLCLDWDPRVSLLHAELVCRAGAWLVLDDGLSTNGTYVNGERVQGRRRLRGGDLLAFGATAVLFRNPGDASNVKTSRVDHDPLPVDVSPAQRRVLVELCRPLATGLPGAVAATNPEIAARLVLSEEAVKSHLRLLFERFDLKDLPQNAKRTRLADVALRTGVIGPRDLL